MKNQVANANGTALYNNLQVFVKQHSEHFTETFKNEKDQLNAKGLRLVIDDGNDYEIILPPCHEMRNEFLIVDLISFLWMLKQSGLVKYHQAGFFVAEDQQSILLYESRDVDVDSKSDFKGVLIS